jgi:hypothetical protein
MSGGVRGVGPRSPTRDPTGLVVCDAWDSAQGHWSARKERTDTSMAPWGRDGASVVDPGGCEEGRSAIEDSGGVGSVAA